MKQSRPVPLPDPRVEHLPDPPGYVPAERPDDQDGFDEGMKISMRSVREILERRRKKP